jgi:alpha-L-rhamnosidase
LPTQFQFGDWCDPDAPGDRPWEAKVSADYVANSFFAHSLDLLARAERLVGEKTAAESFESLSRALKADIWHQMGEAARLTTAGCSIALEFDIAPAEQRTALAQHLADMVKNDEGMITTGFLATPLVLHALSKNGHADAAYAMLMRRDFRSWLYAIDKGATSIWERWDAIREDGSIHTGAMDTEPDGQDDSSMISFNHYAYGAVVDWIYRNVAGIAPSLDGPGYQTAVIEPKPANGLTFAKAEIKSALGKWAIDWKLDPDQKLIVNLDVPFGAKAEVQLPAQGHSVVRCNGVEIGSSLTLTYGKYLLTVTDAAVITY